MPEVPGNRVRLHLDADASRKALHRALLDRGHDVTRTPCPWMPLEADDTTQLLGAMAQGRAIFTFNIRDFSRLAQLYPEHRGILFARQDRWSLSKLIKALDRFLRQVDATDADGQVHWLNSWRH